MALSDKQKRFCDEYLIDLNATQAAIRSGYSVKTANEQGARLLANVSVQEAIAKEMAERSKRTGINQDRVVLELAKMAFVNIDDVVDIRTGAVKENASKDDLACIQSIKYKKSEGINGTSVEREVKIVDKKSTLELLGKHLGMWNDKFNLNVSVPVIISGEDDLED